MDLRLTILDQDPYGEEQILKIERVWLLALIDVATRAILGYTLCLRREYSRYDNFNGVIVFPFERYHKQLWSARRTVRSQGSSTNHPIRPTPNS